MVENTARLIIPDENIATMVVTLCKSNYWVKIEPLKDGKSLIIVRKDTE